MRFREWVEGCRVGGVVLIRVGLMRIDQMNVDQMKVGQIWDRLVHQERAEVGVGVEVDQWLHTLV